jgi:hypothetical protein
MSNKATKVKMSEDTLLKQIRNYRNAGHLSEIEASNVYHDILSRNPNTENILLYNKAKSEFLRAEIMPLLIFVNVIISRITALQDEPEFYCLELKQKGNSFLQELSKYSNKLFKASPDLIHSQCLSDIYERLDKVCKSFNKKTAAKTLEMLYVLVEESQKPQGLQIIDELEYKKGLKGLEAINKIEKAYLSAVAKRDKAKNQNDYNKLNEVVIFWADRRAELK